MVPRGWDCWNGGRKWKPVVHLNIQSMVQINILCQLSEFKKTINYNPQCFTVLQGFSDATTVMSALWLPAQMCAAVRNPANCVLTQCLVNSQWNLPTVVYRAGWHWEYCSDLHLTDRQLRGLSNMKRVLVCLKDQSFWIISTFYLPMNWFICWSLRSWDKCSRTQIWTQQRPRVNARNVTTLTLWFAAAASFSQ